MPPRRFLDLEAAVDGSASEDESSQEGSLADFIDDGSLEALLVSPRASPPRPRPAVRSAAPPAAAAPLGAPPVDPRPIPNISRDEEGEEPPARGQSRKNNWTFTLNAVAGAPLPPPWTVLPQGARYMVFQEEVGAQGTHHYQGYIEFSARKALTAVKAALNSQTVHLKWARGNATVNKEYCSKCCKPCYLARKVSEFSQPQVDCPNCDRIAGPWELGEPGRVGVRTAALEAVRDEGYYAVLRSDPGSLVNVSKVAKELHHMIQQEKRESQGFVPPEIRLLSGQSGCGKSRTFYDNAPPLDRYKLADHSHDKVWFDGYRGQSHVLVEEFNSTIPLAKLKEFLDGYPVTFPVKGGFETSFVRTWWLCTNTEPHKWFPRQRNEEVVALYRRIYYDFGLHQRWDVSRQQFVRVVTAPFEDDSHKPEYERYTYGMTQEDKDNYLLWKFNWDTNKEHRDPAHKSNAHPLLRSQSAPSTSDLGFH